MERITELTVKREDVRAEITIMKDKTGELIFVLGDDDIGLVVPLDMAEETIRLFKMASTED